LVNSLKAEPAIWRNDTSTMSFKVLDSNLIMTRIYLYVLAKSRASSRGNTSKTSVIHLY